MLRTIARRLRSSQPLNYLSTSAVKAAFGPFGGPPERLTKHLPRVGMARSRLPNGRVMSLWSAGDDMITSEVFWRGWASYEPETTRVFYDLACGAGVVLDVGAQVGFYTVLAALANPSSRVLAFEPLHRAAARLRRNVEENSLTNVEVFECALGESTGTAKLFHAPDTTEGIPSSSGLSADFFTLPFFADSGVAARTEVQVKTIDEVVVAGGIQRVDLIKIDTETTEPAVLAGAARVLERDRPDLIFEVLQGYGTGEAITRRLEPLGYAFYLLGEHGPERRERIEEHPTLWNYLARARRPAREAPGGG